MSELHEAPSWSLATRITFRFLFSYFTPYFLLPTLTYRNNFLRVKYTDFVDVFGRR